LTDTNAIRRFVKDARPNWIIHPAALTAVDRAECDPEPAYAINAEAPCALAELAAD
jgi:dTDP-4-dehydrorhamnose reductase